MIDPLSAVRWREMCGLGASAVRWRETDEFGVGAGRSLERAPPETRAHACDPRSRQRTALAT